MKAFRGLSLIAYISFLSFCVGAGGCNNEKQKLSVFQTFPSGGPVKDLWYEFPTPFSDSLFSKAVKDYEVSLMVRFNKRFTQRNLRLYLEENLPDLDTIVASIIEIPMFDSSGEPLSNGAYGLYETEFPLRNISSPIEDYSVSFCSPSESAEGIQAIGLIFSPRI